MPKKKASHYLQMKKVRLHFKILNIFKEEQRSQQSRPVLSRMALVARVLVPGFLKQLGAWFREVSLALESVRVPR